MKHRHDPFQAGAAFRKEAQAADRAAAAGDFHQAASKFRSLLRKHPNDVKLMNSLGRCQLGMGRAREAEKQFRNVLRKSPSDLPAIIQLSTILYIQDKFNEAHKVIDTALRELPEHPRVLSMRANLFMTEGRFDEAMAVLESDLERHPTSINLALSFSVVAGQAGREAEAIVALRRALDDPDMSKEYQITGLCALGRLYDASGAYDRAFESFSEAGAIKNAYFDPVAFESAVEEITRCWTRDAIAALPKVSVQETGRCIFIVGMPRSGTTLIEQILDAHPEVRGLGELIVVEKLIKSWMHGFSAAGVPLLTDPQILTQDMLERGRETYLRSTVREHGRGFRVIDKAPINFMHLGAIASMLPAARIIHCQRNPVDTCLSCFTHDFAGSSYAFTYDLKHLGTVYRGYERLMEHWASVLDMSITQVVYEELVADQVRISRELVESLDLSWDEQCLRFYESKRIARTSSRDQVRKPIFNSSVDRSKRYGTLLQPLIDALEPLSES